MFFVRSPLSDKSELFPLFSIKIAFFYKLSLKCNNFLVLKSFNVTTRVYRSQKDLPVLNSELVISGRPNSSDQLTFI